MKCILTCAFVAALTAAGMQCSRTLTLAGGGTETTNGSITGKLVNETGQPARHTRVWLHTAMFNPFTDSPAQKTWADTTDSMGNYSIRLPVPNIYTFQAVQLDKRTRALVGNVEAYDSVVVVATDTLRIAGTVKVLLSSAADTVNGYVYVPGTDILGFAGGRGYAILDSVPAGIVPLVSFADKNSPGQSQAIRYDVTVEPSDTAVVANTLWKYSKKVLFNTTSAGADVAGNVYNFPVLIRLTESNFDFSQAGPAGDDIRFTKKDNTPISYEIERWNAAANAAEIWVKLDTVFGNDSSHFITMYWGASTGSATASLSNGAAVFDTANGFQGVWHLNEASGSTAKDATANRFDGVPPSDSSPLPTPGVIGMCEEFNGESNYIQMPGTASGKLNFPENGSYSIAAWVYADTLDSSFAKIIEKHDLQYKLQKDQLNRWEFSEYESAREYSLTTSAASAKAWVYLTGVRSGGSQYLYVNGVCVNSTITTLATPYSRDTADNITIGRNAATDFGPLYFFKGKIDEARIENMARSADWIKLCYMNQKAGDALVVFRP
jgi:hypothetical protein